MSSTAPARGSRTLKTPSSLGSRIALEREWLLLVAPGEVLPDVCLSDLPSFAIKSITHEKNLCEVEINDIVREVHAIPDARISQGKNFIENVEEGEARILAVKNGLS